MPSPHPRAAAARAMRVRLIDAAIHQLAHEGMRGLTHRRVEHRAGVSQGLVKHHFGTLDGLIEAVLTHMVDSQIPLVPLVDPEAQADALASGTIPPAFVAQFDQIMAATFADRDAARARFELYLHAADRPELQAIIERAREAFIERTAQSLPSADPKAAARMVLALIDGLLLTQLAAPSDDLAARAGQYVIVAGAAGMHLPPRSIDLTRDHLGSRPPAENGGRQPASD